MASLPLLLIIDDLEQILEEPKADQSVLVKPAYRAMLGAVLKCFHAADTPSRLLLTSRYRFILLDDDGKDLAAGLYDLPLPEMSDAERQRQLRAERELQVEKAEAVDVDDRRSGLFERALAVAKGNPGLQSLLTDQVMPDPDLADEAISEVETYHEEGRTPKTGDLGEFFQKLTLRIYQKALTPPEVSQLRAGLVFNRAVPRPILALGGEVSGVDAPEAAIERLISLGHLDVTCSGDQILLSVNALVRPLFDALSNDDRQVLASTVAAPLADAYRDDDGDLPLAEVTVEIARLAKLAGDQPVLQGEAAFQSAFFLYRRHGLAEPALEIVNSGLEALLAAEKPLDPHGMRLAIECAHLAGNPELQDRWLDHDFGSEGDASALAMIKLRRAERDIRRGEVDQGERTLREAAATFKTAEDERMIAITQGQIADILVRRGELDEAIALQKECLQTHRHLKDPDGIAAAQWELAHIALIQQRFDDAIPRITEAYVLFDKIGRIEGIASGQQDRGRAVLEKSASAFQKLGRDDRAKEIRDLLDQLGEAT